MGKKLDYRRRQIDKGYKRRQKGMVLLTLSANFIITADAFASAAIFGVEKRMGVILSHWGFCKNPEGEESLFAACLTKNGICDKLEKRQ